MVSPSLALSEPLAVPARLEAARRPAGESGPGEYVTRGMWVCGVWVWWELLRQTAPTALYHTTALCQMKALNGVPTSTCYNSPLPQTHTADRSPLLP